METGASESLLGSKIVLTKSEVEDPFEIVEQIWIDVRKNLGVLPNKELIRILVEKRGDYLCSRASGSIT